MILKLAFPFMTPMSKQHSGGVCGKRHYVKAKYVEWKYTVGWMAREQAKTQKWVMSEYHIDLKMEISVIGAKRLDLDNIAGGIMDALNGVIYTDDGQIMELIVRKYPLNKDPKQFYVSITESEINSREA